MTDPTAREGHGTGQLMTISDIRALFRLGRTAAYQLTLRPGFPAPVRLSPRCLRWWDTEVRAYAAALQHEGAPPRTRRTTTRPASSPGAQPRRITGTVRAARSHPRDRE